MSRATRALRLAWLLPVCLMAGCVGETDVDGHALFDTVSLSVDFALNGRGEDVDSIAFHEASDPRETRMFVTAKGRELLEVWQFPFSGNELPPLEHPLFDPDDTNGVVVDAAMRRLYVTVPAEQSTVAVFTLPDLAFVQEFVSGEVDLGEEPNIALLRLPDGQTRAYVSSETTVYVYDAATGEAIGSFVPPRGLETMVGDEYHQVLYIPDENDRTGVYAFDPDGNPYVRNGTSVFGEGIFDADAEGILIYACSSDKNGDRGEGWIVVSDQVRRRTEFEFFDRVTWEHLGTLVLDGVNLTDGIGSTQQAMPGYPLGLFAAVDDDSSVVGIGWHRILEATGLTCRNGDRIRN